MDSDPWELEKAWVHFEEVMLGNDFDANDLFKVLVANVRASLTKYSAIEKSGFVIDISADSFARQVVHQTIASFDWSDIYLLYAVTQSALTTQSGPVIDLAVMNRIMSRLYDAYRDRIPNSLALIHTILKNGENVADIDLPLDVEDGTVQAPSWMTREDARMIGDVISDVFSVATSIESKVFGMMRIKIGQRLHHNPITPVGVLANYAMRTRAFSWLLDFCNSCEVSRHLLPLEAHISTFLRAESAHSIHASNSSSSNPKAPEQVSPVIKAETQHEVTRAGKRGGRGGPRGGRGISGRGRGREGRAGRGTRGLTEGKEDSAAQNDYTNLASTPADTWDLSPPDLDDQWGTVTMWEGAERNAW
ncbi:hypothetical protein SCUP234_07915 [Seiridium cupressi]